MNPISSRILAPPRFEIKRVCVGRTFKYFCSCRTSQFLKIGKYEPCQRTPIFFACMPLLFKHLRYSIGCIFVRHNISLYTIISQGNFGFKLLATTIVCLKASMTLLSICSFLAADIREYTPGPVIKIM